MTDLVKIEIDLNVRVKGNLTYAGFENVTGALPAVGTRVKVYESESELSGYATVASLDHKRKIIYLDVDWTLLHD